MNKRVVLLVQARMGSTRLPGKVLADILGQPMLARVLQRVRAARSVDHLAVATSTEPGDDPIVHLCAELRVDCFRGHPTDVLDRFYRAAQSFHADAVVRITADCPLIDSRVIDHVISVFRAGEWDYVSNTVRSTFPDGMDVEVFSFAALEKAWQETPVAADREHVTPFLRHSGLFSVKNVEKGTGSSHSDLRWTVDEPADLEFVRALYHRLSSSVGGMEEVMAVLSSHPELRTIPSQVRNEGYYRSLAQEPALPPMTRSVTHSLTWKERAQRVIPSCSQTFSKSPNQFVQGVAPVFLSRGQGCCVWDVDDNEYIDYSMALGPVILGHNDPTVTNAVNKQITNGTIFSLPHPLEVELAEELVALIPCADMVRFGKNGSDATSGAVRLARAYTGREVIACCGYHGWQDWYIGTTTRNKGVPTAVRDLTVPFLYNDLNSLERIFKNHPHQVAAVVMEPVGVVNPIGGFLESVKDLAHRHGALLIFDEVVTGFRVALGGAQEYFDVTPDLACFGKALANGMPLSAVVGRGEIMELFDEIFFSFTFGGETLALAAARAVLQEMRTKNVIAHLWEQGRKLKDGYNVLSRSFGLENNTRCVGLSPRTIISFSDSDGKESLILKSLFQQECLKRGVLFTGAQNVSYSHSDGDVARTLRVYRSALEVLAQALRAGDVVRRLEGPPIQSVFRRP